MLALTGLRLNEVARARWREIDLARRTWIIPKERMKGKNTRAREHVVPLASEAIALLEALPRFNGGDFVFSNTHGRAPAHISAKIKKAVDAALLDELRVMAAKRGDDPDRAELPPWTNHDIRRTVRSGLSRLRVADEVAEAILAHVRPGIRGTYDRYKYFDEKKDALARWAADVTALAHPPPAESVDDNVVPMPRSRAQ